MTEGLSADVVREMDEAAARWASWVQCERDAGRMTPPRPAPPPVARPVRDLDAESFGIDAATLAPGAWLRLMDGLDAAGIHYVLGGDGVIVPTAEAERAWEIVQRIINE